MKPAILLLTILVTIPLAMVLASIFRIERDCHGFCFGADNSESSSLVGNTPVGGYLDACDGTGTFGGVVAGVDIEGQDMNDRVFFVVGAAKAGTTSIYHYLKQHPEVHVHAYKDVACYFCARAGLPITFEEFRALLIPQVAEFTVTGDVCSDYLTEMNAAREIATAFPGAKIIIVLRNPADRAFSLYQWMLREGYEYLPTFKAALEAESKRAARKLKGSDLVSSSKDAYLYFRGRRNGRLGSDAVRHRTCGGRHHRRRPVGTAAHA